MGVLRLLSNRDSVIHQIINVPISDKKLITDIRNNNATMQNLHWKVEGSAIIESGFSSSNKNFVSSW